MPPGLVSAPRHQSFSVTYRVGSEIFPLRWRGSTNVPQSRLRVLRDATRSTAIAVGGAASSRPEYYEIVDSDQPTGSAEATANRSADSSPLRYVSSRNASSSPRLRTQLATSPMGIVSGDVTRPVPGTRQASPPRLGLAESTSVSLKCWLTMRGSFRAFATRLLIHVFVRPMKASQVWPQTLTLGPAMSHIYPISPSPSGAVLYNVFYYVQGSPGGRVFPLRWRGTQHMSRALAAALQAAPLTVRASREQSQRGGPEFYDIVGTSPPADGVVGPEGRNRSLSRPASQGNSRGTSAADPARTGRAAATVSPETAALQQNPTRARAPRDLSVSLQRSMSRTRRR